MSSFIRVYRTVTRCCVVFNYQQKSGVVLNLQRSQDFLKGIRFISRDATCSSLQDCRALSEFEQMPQSHCQHLLNPLWLNMKTKQMKANSTSKKKKHKHKKKKSKRTSKSKSKFTMAVAEAILPEDSSSDSEILVVFEAKRPPRPVHKVQVEEILLDDDTPSCSMNTVLLHDIPLPKESCDSVNLSLIPLPQEEHLPVSVQNQFTTYIRNVRESIDIAKFREEIREPVVHEEKEDISIINNYENELIQEKARLRHLRSWESTYFGRQFESSGAKNGGTVFSVMSYNVLSQKLLEDHKFLYTGHDVRTLTWEHRSQTLLNEFRTANADVLCLQEVQFDHLEWFNDQLSNLGYRGLFKRRTHDHVDGCAIYFKQDRFSLIESSSVEYYQPNVQVLDRDNVALVARLEVVGSDQQLIVATTHLLFNPRRHDIKLAQMQLLLAELERVAYLRYDSSLQKSVYRPVIITGDLNLQPSSAVYRFITDGFINYSVLSARTLQPTSSDLLQQSLLPPDLEISNTCQHLGIIQHRRSWRHETLEGLLNELRLLRLFNSDNASFINQYGRTVPSCSVEDGVRQFRGDGLGNNSVPNLFKANDCFAEETKPGMLSHSFPLKSVYRHFKKDSSSRALKEATTHQQAWVTVDYIFYSGTWNEQYRHTVEGPLKLLSRFCLPTEDQCERDLKHIPNMACGSDHLPLLARFLLRS